MQLHKVDKQKRTSYDKNTYNHSNFSLIFKSDIKRAKLKITFWNMALYACLGSIQNTKFVVKAEDYW